MKRKNRVCRVKPWETGVCFFVDRHRTDGELLYSKEKIKRCDTQASVHVRMWPFDLDKSNPMHAEMLALIEEGTVVLKAVV